MQLRDDGRGIPIPFPNMWNFPGGTVEPHETPLEGAIREISEEFKIQINPMICREIWKYTHEHAATDHIFLCAVPAHTEPVLQERHASCVGDERHVPAPVVAATNNVLWGIICHGNIIDPPQLRFQFLFALQFLNLVRGHSGFHLVEGPMWVLIPEIHSDCQHEVGRETWDGFA